MSKVRKLVENAVSSFARSRVMERCPGTLRRYLANQVEEGSRATAKIQYSKTRSGPR